MDIINTKFNEKLINGITFYIANDIDISENIILYLTGFSKTADDDCYSVYLDNGELVVY